MASALEATRKNGGKRPAIYGESFYLLLRLEVALGPAGGLPLLLDASNRLTAFYLGVSAPLVLDRLQRTMFDPSRMKPEE
jgi:hypothetical protein